MIIEQSASTQAEAALLDLDGPRFRELIAEALAAHSTVEVFERLVSPALEHIGRSWEEGDLALAQVYMASRMVERVVEEHLIDLAPSQRSHPPIAMAVLEDHHHLGKRLVLSGLRMAGWSVEDWGVAEDPLALAERAHARGLDLLLISTLMDRAARRVALVVGHLKELGASTRVVVGGAPFRLNPNLCREVGAVATATVASAVPDLLTNLVGAP